MDKRDIYQEDNRAKRKRCGTLYINGETIMGEPEYLEVIRNRFTILFAEYVIMHNATVRETAQAFRCGRNMVQTYLQHRLPLLDERLFREVHKVFLFNKGQNTIRANIATKRKRENK